MNQVLSPMDYYFFRPRLYTIQFVFNYEGHLEADRLRTGLGRLAQALPPLTARLMRKGSELYLRSGIETEISLKLCSFRDRPASQDGRVDPVSNLLGEALVKFQLNEEGLHSSLGVSFSHVLGDGASFFRMLQILSSLTLRKGIPLAPLHNRGVLIPQGSLSKERPTDADFFSATGYALTGHEPRPGLEARTLRFDRAQLKELCREAGDKTGSVFPNEALMAFIAKNFALELPRNKDGKVILRCPVDYRRIHPGLSPTFFGNAVLDALVEFDEQEIPAMSLNEAALRVRKAIRSVTLERVEASLRALQALRESEGPEAFLKVACPGLVVTNLSRIPMEALDFGKGAPRAVSSASVSPGFAGILPIADGGVEIALS